MLKDGTLVVVTPELREKLAEDVNGGKQNIVKHQGQGRNTLNMFVPAASPATGQTLYKAVVQSGTAQSGYECSLFDLVSGEQIGSGIVFPTQLAYNSTLPYGTVLLAHAVTVKTVGGND